jgi:two-component system, NarL family, invasion response regulator UvrY
MIRILIADDHAIVRQGLKQVLGAAPGRYEIGESPHANDAIRKVREERWDIVLLDINLPGKNGIEALKQIRLERPDTRVLIFSFHTEDSFALRALKNGACGYITKNSPPDQLIAAITRVVRGGKYITQSVAERLASVFDADFDRPPHENLTDREFQIFNLLACGKTVSEIAVELSLSVKTISTHRAKILNKMQLRNNAELMHYSVYNLMQESLGIAEETAPETP